MSRIDELIAALCPEGVGFKMLEELGATYGGLTGKSKADFSAGNARFVSYKNIFNNLAVNLDANDFVKVGSGENQNFLVLGDVLFTGSSETPDEVGMSSVVIEKPSEAIYLNSFCFGYRFNNDALLLPTFSKYLFRSYFVRQQIVMCASGVTRFNISKKRFLKVCIPIPPTAIQYEIVKVLDTFTTLEAELEAELEARRRQYQYYRDALLTFGEGTDASGHGEDGAEKNQWKPTGINRIDELIKQLCPNGVDYKAIGDLGELVRGNGMPKSDFVDSGIGCIHYGQIYTYYGIWTTRTKSFVSLSKAERLAKVDPGDLVITNTSENVEDVCKAVAWIGEVQIVTGGHATV
ncbi:MAG TPA: restriction endonuclease subunit S, partial [Xylella fastidiosa subsp. pauca]